MILDELVKSLYESSNDAREVLSKIKDIATSNDNVVLTFYDGSTLTIPSLPQLQNTINNFVNNAETNIKSWWNITFYVDAVDGSDDNDGSQNAPFKTIQKAIDSVPVGGYVRIKLVSNYTGGFDAKLKNIRIEIPSNITWIIPMGTICDITSCSMLIFNEGKLIIDRGDGSNINPDNYAGFFVTNYEHKHFLSNITNLYLINYKASNPVRIDSDRALFGSRLYGYNQNIQINLGIYNIYSKGDFIIDGMLLRLNKGTGSFQWNNYSNDTSFKIVDSTGSSVDIHQKIGGVIRDSNGVPRNILSNIVL